MHKTSPDESKELPGQVPVPKSLQRRNTTRASFTAESYGLDQETIRSSFRGISETAEFKQELKQLIHSYDTNNDGTFDEDEVERIVRDVKQAAFHAQEIEKLPTQEASCEYSGGVKAEDEREDCSAYRRTSESDVSVGESFVSASDIWC